MNPPEIKNVTPGTLVPATPRVATGGPRLAGRGPNRIVAIVLLLVVLVVAYKLLHHHRNHNEATADAVTIAIANNNMAPVLHAFDTTVMPGVENRVNVARLANFVAPLGHFKSSKEITPAGSRTGFHEFTETFANGTADEKYQLDDSGKIVKFHIGPVPSASSAP